MCWYKLPNKQFLKWIITVARLFLVVVISGLILNISVQGATSPSLSDYDISPRTASPGDIITFSYTIVNPGSDSVTVGLGATIQLGSNAYSDVPHDALLTIPPGTSFQTRPFQIPNDAQTGYYNVLWGLWEGVSGHSNQLQLANRPQYLIVSQATGTAQPAATYVRPPPIVNGIVASELTGPSHVIIGQEFGVQMIVKPNTNPVAYVNLGINYDGTAIQLTGIKTEDVNFTPYSLSIGYNSNPLTGVITSESLSYLATSQRTETQGFVLMTVTFRAIKVQNNTNINYLVYAAPARGTSYYGGAMWQGIGVKITNE